MNTYKFNHFLFENKISDALKILNVDSDYTQDSLKLAFKRAASKAHPDKGGSDAMMRDVRTAYDFLSNTMMTPINKKENDNSLYDELAEIVISTVDKSLNVSKFKEYFEKNIKQTVTHTREAKKYGGGYSSWVSIIHTWETQDKKTKLILELSTHLGDAKYSGGGLSNSKNAIFSTQVTPTTYVDGRKKVLKNKWMSTNDSNFFDKPDKIFSKASITSKKGKFGKKDMLFGLTNRANAVISGDLYLITIADGKHAIGIYRGVMMREAHWSVYDVYIVDGKKKVSSGEKLPRVGYLAETEEVMEAFIAMTKASTVKEAYDLMKAVAL